MILKLASLALSLLTGSLWRWPIALPRWICASAARIWAALAIIALALAGWQAHRAAHWADTARQTQTAWDAERKVSQAAQHAAKAQSKQDAHDADTNHTTLVQGGAGRFAAYAVDHGLRQNTAHRPGPVQAEPPALPESPSPDAIMADISRVWITRADWLTCDADWAYAQAAHDWAKGIGE
ncbi:MULTISPECIES: hypothetical protein [unclassified Novosphingobium]|uniref:hypothetical protein n=1 Tax=unclassified Novosphingobium TaxID=2644732 RepID=UPI000869DA62|nr:MULTISPECIES: hypothetical protein [unclassified Novosphingobium]MBN9146520.1 hypothetical protein [Novosphingobium sp.]MDR6710289.1 hypothetical protein [Novosphingobium sp. 1748]ODU78114.1 MAG: hypothetical protein ABT10_23335 [Novosphingobium sp. SCN 63-17]OJX91034.1 MAG: hypothetical protein BGP00_07400 [Novosphingobium sp. 63-713]